MTYQRNETPEPMASDTPAVRKKPFHPQADYVLDLLVAAGHITREKAFQARDIAVEFGPDAAPGAPGQEALRNKAPRRIYLDIGDQFALEGILAGTTDWQVEGVTWSEDNATSHGVEYVRADLASPALSGEPAGWMFQNDVTGNVGFVDAQQVEWGFWKNNPRLHEICPLYRAALPEGAGEKTS